MSAQSTAIKRDYVHAHAASQVIGFRSVGSLRNFVAEWNRRNPKKPIRRLQGGYYHARDLYRARKEFIS